VKELRVLVIQAKMGDHHAYETIVRRFQDMAVGYGYTLLGDIDLAEDVAQEAFINAFYHLPDLLDPTAFPGWFRRIVSTQVHRLKRRNEVATIPLDQSPELASHGQLGADPAEVIEQREVRGEVHAAIAALPRAQREVVTLFYISSYSQKEISAFLDIPVTTVKMRLYYARKQLKERMIAMIEDNLQKQRPSKDDAFVEKVMNLNDRVIEMDKVLQRTISEGVDLKTILAPNPWSIKADPTQAEQVIINLVVNACEAMPHGGRLTIETVNVTLDDRDEPPHFGEQPGEYVLLTVSDTGLGMSDEVLPHIFEPSFTTKEKRPGLGLATVYDFVKRNKGYIWVCSEEGNGTAFQIYLPRSDS
jgi:RNA polymerase sigma factor (sigma-70 family)